MSNSLLPEAITKEMKTEDEILAQMRASQAESAQNLSFMPDAVNPEEAFTAGTNIAPNLEELQKLIESDVHVGAAQLVTSDAAGATTPPATQRPHSAAAEKEKKTEKAAKTEPIPEVSARQQAPIKTVEAKEKTVKQPVKTDEKPVKTKELATTKAKTKKQKDDKKEDPSETKTKEEGKKPAESPTAEQEYPLLSGSWFHDNIIKRLQNRSEETSPIDSEIDEQKRTEEPSPPKNKKDDKTNKKDLEKEKKEWLKDGFTLVKGAEKKDSKKKEKEEARAAEEAEKKRIEEEKRALIEAEKNRTPEPVTRRQQMESGQVQRQPQPQAEAVPKKAPWSAPAATRDGLALSDIQRLEREKKLEQIKEQQLMMQAIAQQQAAAAHREQQEIQAGQQGWAKKKQPNNSPPGQTLAEIQAEARLQAATIAAAATAAAREEAQATPPPVNITPWGSTNGGGFWDSPSSIAFAGSSSESKSKISATRQNVKQNSPKLEQDAPQREPTTLTALLVENKPNKKVTVSAPPKKETSPSADFETWCNNVLSNWGDAANIDIPTFVAFLRDIESPYEVKDYVKCYLGDTKDSTDFSRQFLERRSRLLRVGMVTPSDDLCSPAVAINPRTSSGSDYTEVKSKGKKSKKNKMFKVDARILGFSVTASEDRINIGDIDTV